MKADRSRTETERAASGQQRGPLAARRRRAIKARMALDPAAGPGFTIITGLSGAGRSEAARCLEDLGYFVVDNLPPALLPKMAELASRPGGPGRVAIV
ncbi:MAG TPA: RNase adapter RapZ, partial [Actinomycetota bacterium]|nr:RNase adapter RapZ [Actinomycetota bacterium]